jgi:hypothetical protein
MPLKKGPRKKPVNNPKLPRGGAVNTPKGVKGPVAEIKKRDGNRLVKIY